MRAIHHTVRGIVCWMLSAALLLSVVTVAAYGAEEPAPPTVEDTVSEETYIELQEPAEEAPPVEMAEPTPGPDASVVPEEAFTPEETLVPQIVLELPEAPVQATGDAEQDLTPDDPDDPLYYRIYGNDGGIMTLAYGGKTYSNFTTRALQVGETLHKGIDVSEFQGTIDWNAVAASGVEFVFIRVAFRGTGTGALNPDAAYKKNLAGAKAAGLKVGAYIFSQAITEEEGRKEAQYLIDLVKNYDIDLPLVIDYEYAGNPGRLKAAKLSRQQKTDICQAFCKEAERAGYEGMVYANYSMLYSDMYAEQLDRVWLAHFTSSTGYPGAYEYWQCSDSGSVSGISGYVDLDFWFQHGSEEAPPEQTVPTPTPTAQPEGKDNPFTDVTEKNWYYESVMQAYRAGVVTGVSATSFSPNDNATRGQVVTMIYRMEGEPEVTTTTSFADLTAEYYKKAVAWAAANKVVNGISETSFAPGDCITREDLVTMLYRLAQSPSVSEDLSGYSDASAIHSYARPAMAWAVKNGIITGYTDGSLKPGNKATRAEVCAILMRFTKLLG